MFRSSAIRGLRVWAVCCLPLIFSTTAAGEYRVALLIGNSDYQNQEQPVPPQNLAAVAESFERYGFQCRVVENLGDERALRDAIETFAGSTPTCSTALLYYRGRLGDDGDLLAVDSRSRYALDRIFDALANKGGSRRNLVLIDAPGKFDFQGDLPEACQVTFASTNSLLAKLDGQADMIEALASVGAVKKSLPERLRLVGKGSEAISPPEAFVPGRRAGDEWVNSMGLVFCWCPPGKYVAGSPMGVPGRYPDEEQQDVVISDGFWLSKYELGRGQEVANRRPGGNTIARHKLDPMTMINYDDARTMTRNFTDAERQAGRLSAGWQYSLPSEEQWEYAARAGTTTRFFFGEEMNRLPQYANFADKAYYDSGDIYSNAAHRTLSDRTVKLARLGSYEANPWGFHDIYGNVAEWCINYAIRGGSWASVPENCRSAYRDSFSSRNEQNFIGYRLVIQTNSSAAKNE